MSYYCSVSFKKLKPQEIQPFFTSFKKEIIAHLDEIAEANYTYCPFFDEFEKIELTKEVREKMDSWAAKVFRHKFYFELDGTLLCVFGPPKCTEHLFDATIAFQNSCDQDYDFDTWNGIPEFESIVKKWELCSDEDVAKEMAKRDYDLDSVNYDYYRRSFCYESIFDTYVAKYLYDDYLSMHLSVFGRYDLLTVRSFCRKCIDLVNKHNKQFEKENNI